MGTGQEADRWSRSVKFDYYLLNTYHPDVDGPAPELYAKWVEQVTLAEQLGFDCAWFTEHHFGRFGGMLPSPQMLIASLGPQTSRIRLGTAVVLLVMHHPLLVAEETAMLDNLTNGRLNVGVGRGMPTQPLQLFGTDPATAQHKLEEQVQILREAWAGNPLTWEGKYYAWSRPITPMPRPLQQPHPPLWMPANREPAHARWIGRNGINLMTVPWLMGFEVTRGIIDAYKEGLREGGHSRDEFDILGYLPIYVGETPDSATRESEVYWQGFCNVTDEERGGPMPDRPPCEALVKDSKLIFGDAAACRQHIERIRSELDTDRLALMFHFGGMPQELAIASMRRFAKDVAPSFV